MHYRNEPIQSCSSSSERSVESSSESEVESGLNVRYENCENQLVAAIKCVPKEQLEVKNRGTSQDPDELPISKTPNIVPNFHLRNYYSICQKGEKYDYVQSGLDSFPCVPIEYIEKEKEEQYQNLFFVHTSLLYFLFLYLGVLKTQ